MPNRVTLLYWSVSLANIWACLAWPVFHLLVYLSEVYQNTSNWFPKPVYHVCFNLDCQSFKQGQTNHCPERITISKLVYSELEVLLCSSHANYESSRQRCFNNPQWTSPAYYGLLSKRRDFAFLVVVQLEGVITRVHHLCAKPWTLLHFWSPLHHTICSIGLTLAPNFLQKAFFPSWSLESWLLPCTYAFGDMTLDSLDRDGRLLTLRASPCYLIHSCQTHRRASVNTCGMTERRKTES